MRDPFEESLRDLLNKPSVHDDDACLGRVLKIGQPPSRRR